jgi:hypothetical protein
MNARQPIASLCGILILAACSRGVLAQPAPPPTTEAPWVQIEVIAFRHTGGDASGEKWPVAPDLSYPAPLRFLLEPGSPEHTAALEAREFERALQAEAGSAAPAAPAAPTEAAQLSDELPGVLLPPPETVLADAAARIANAPGYRLLAHLAWREPALREGSSEHVLITGGGSAGDHRELEGSIAITRSRFLHLDARVWLNDFPAPGEAPGPEAVDLPPLPKPPLPQPPPGAQADTPATPDPVTEAPPEEPVVAVEPVRATRSVVLAASRRIAPGEVHYIDHPLFGLLVTVRPWSPAAAVDPGSLSPPATVAPGTPAAAPAPAPAQPGR